jgi:hypothetical protein
MSPHTNVNAHRVTLSGRIQIGRKSGYYCQSQARKKPKRCLVGFIFTLETIIKIINNNNKTTFVSYLNFPVKGCPKGKQICVWSHLGLIKWKTTLKSKKIKDELKKIEDDQRKIEGNQKKHDSS